MHSFKYITFIIFYDTYLNILKLKIYIEININNKINKKKKLKNNNYEGL